jgi:glycosyltransferase involved in cell wall biosynthesis
LPDFSIILPVYNGGEMVKDCINSILLQSLPDFQLHILDNSSTDGTLQWVQSLTDHRIVCYPAEKPLTMEANWGRIVNIPKNKFITLIGHDDLLHPHYLQTMADLIQQHPEASLYQAHFIFIDAEGNEIRPCQPMAEVQSADEFLACQFTKTLDSMGTGYMMRSSDFDAAGGMGLRYPGLIFADYALWVKLTLLNYKATTPTTAFSYRLHNNASKRTNGEDYQQAFGEYVYFLAGLRSGNPKIAAVLDRYGKQMLLYFCESLSHRLLKTALTKRHTRVGVFINKCRQYANLLIPGQSFHPMLKPRILLAALLDNKPGIAVFNFIKKYPGASAS